MIIQTRVGLWVNFSDPFPSRFMPETRKGVNHASPNKTFCESALVKRSEISRGDAVVAGTAPPKGPRSSWGVTPRSRSKSAHETQIKSFAGLRGGELSFPDLSPGEWSRKQNGRLNSDTRRVWSVFSPGRNPPAFDFCRRLRSSRMTRLISRWRSWSVLC